MSSTRHVILHYHLFKNAGTSLDAVLKRAFPGEWVTAEFPGAGGDNSGALAAWIEAEPEVKVFSTHTGRGPVPVVPGVEVFPVIFLREPISRIRSAYRFERKQEADTLGAKLAREHDLAGYVDARLAMPRDRQCRNFQTYRMAGFVPARDEYGGRPGELERALRALRTLPLVGLVERFDESLARLAAALPPELALPSVGSAHTNRTERSGEALEEGLRETLRTANALDTALYATAIEAFDQAARPSPAPPKGDATSVDGERTGDGPDGSSAGDSTAREAKIIDIA